MNLRESLSLYRDIWRLISTNTTVNHNQYNSKPDCSYMEGIENPEKFHDHVGKVLIMPIGHVNAQSGLLFILKYQ